MDSELPPVQNEVKLFSKWSYQDVEIKDVSLVDYITTTQNPTYLPHTAGRYQTKRFRKAACPIAERLACSLMMHGRNSGKKLMAVSQAFGLLFRYPTGSRQETQLLCSVSLLFIEAQISKSIAKSQI